MAKCVSTSSRTPKHQRLIQFAFLETLLITYFELPDIRGIEDTKPPFIRTPFVSPGSVSVTRGGLKMYNIISIFKTLWNVQKSCFFARRRQTKLGHFGISKETPLFVPDMQQGGFLTSIPLIHVILHLPALQCRRFFISNLCNSVKLFNF